MEPFIIFCVMAVLPAVLAFALGVNSVLLFLSVAVGLLLQQSLADSAVLVVSGFISNSPDMVTNVGLLVLPVALTLLLLRKSSNPKTLVLQIAPLFLTGVTFAYLVMAQLGPDFQSQVYASQFGPSIQQANDVVVGLAAVLNLLLAWGLNRQKHDSKHSKKH